MLVKALGSGACLGATHREMVPMGQNEHQVRGEEAVISADDSKVKVVVIPTDEELMIATDTMNLL